ncbi:MAG: VWA domain-containing protein [Acidobacteria bacterium]|nr:MAG: VWA domain-containing protein [Acidobacteriota bacterium]
MRPPRHLYVSVALVSRSALVALLAAVALAPVIAQQKQPPATANQGATAAAPSPTPNTASTSGATNSLTSGAPVATPVAAAANASTVVGTPVADGEQVIVNADLVLLNVTLTDVYNRYVTGLNKDAFTVFDDKEPQQITFFSDEDVPISLGVIFDVSGSMSGDKIQKAREALRHFIDTSHNNDEYFLIGFNSRAQLLMDKTRDSDAMLDKLTFVQTKGQTALYDACYLGVERVSHGVHPKRALLVISDGQDNNSRYTFSELRKMLKETDVLIYGIGIEGGGGSELDVAGEAILDELASVSGGKAFFPKSAAEMNEIFERIAIELRHQYSIGYKPSNFTNDGRWHRIKVKVTPPRGLPHLFVRSKDGYYATLNPR